MRKRPHHTEPRELLHIPRESRDSADTFVYEPAHVDERPLGNLYLVGHIEEAHERERNLLSALALEARHGYYRHSARIPEENFSAALRRLNTYRAERAEQDALELTADRFHIAVAAIAGGTLYLAEAGSAFSYIVRGNNATPIGRDAPASFHGAPKLFTNFIRGKLAVGDLILIATPHFADEFLLRGTRYSHRELPEEFSKKLREHFARDRTENMHARERHAAAGIIIQYLKRETALAFAPPARPLSWRADTGREGFPQSFLARFTEGILGKSAQEATEQANHAARIAREPGQEPVSESARVRDRRLGRLAKALLLLPGDWRPARWFPARIFGAVTLAALIVFGIGITLGRLERTFQEESSAADYIAVVVLNLKRLRSTADAPLREAMRAEISRSLAALPSGHRGTELARLAAILDEAALQFRREQPLEFLETRAEFSRFPIPFSPEKILVDGDTVFVLHWNIATALKIQANAAAGNIFFTGIPFSGSIRALAVTPEVPPRVLYLTEANELIGYSPHDKAFSRIKLPMRLDPENAVALESGFREFFVVTEAQELFRVNFQTKKPQRIAVPRDGALAGFKSAAVLSPSLFIASRDGDILKFAGGVFDGDVSLRGIARLSNSFRLRALQEAGVLAILDSENTQIILFDVDGTVKRQYRHDLFLDMRDIALDTNGNLLVLTKERLLRFPFK